MNIMHMHTCGVWGGVKMTIPLLPLTSGLLASHFSFAVLVVVFPFSLTSLPYPCHTSRWVFLLGFAPKVFRRGRLWEIGSGGLYPERPCCSPVPGAAAVSGSVLSGKGAHKRVRGHHGIAF